MGYSCCELSSTTSIFSAFFTFFFFSLGGRGMMAAVETDCFFFKNFLSLLGRMAVVLVLDLSSWVVLCLYPFLFLDLERDLSVLSRRMRTLLSFRGCDFYSRLLRCRLLMEGLFGFNFLRVCLSSMALPQELLYFRLSYASLIRVVSSMTIWCRLAFLLTEFLLRSDSRSCFLLFESSDSRLRFCSG